MKVAILGNANSVHIKKWAEGLVNEKIEIHLISLHKVKLEYSQEINFHQLKFGVPFGYLVSYKELKSILKTISPDILNVHYASGYGTLSNLVGFTPTILSIWGSDVFDFPEKTFLHKKILKNNLKSASAIASTSHCMLKVSDQIYKHPNSYVTPFGVDINHFKPKPKPKPKVGNRNKFTIGTVKYLSEKYGIDILINAFSILYHKYGSTFDLELIIVGEGPQKDELIILVEKLKLSKYVKFLGALPHAKIPEIINTMDVFSALSRYDSESFGVAVVEACACGKPVVVSDVSGFCEVVINNSTGLIVPREDASSAAKAIERLLISESLRIEIGELARKYVVKTYSWDISIRTMINSYDRVLKSNQYEQKK
ncbi:putative glycosyl transferase [Marinomonas sp. MED121]|uniref:glycosyltransferase n=1 Tax=Marinomonas sp. MED121 TaxID=314277 RepID=UPI00006900A0|nr:glycosyltransferase [Marinomonas sp. MED121]EAQ65690.1 putative glycosyl transferase [Marinomonas sp. MED121]